MPYIDRTVFTTNDQSSGEVADPNKLEANDSHIADVVDANYTELHDFVNGNNISKLGIVNVEDYGAVGDGTTDDTTKIQNAIDSLTNGGVVYFPEGTFLISSLSLKSNIILKGYSKNLSAVKSNSTNATLFDLTNLSYVSVESLKIDWKPTTKDQYNQGVFLLSNTNNVKVQDAILDLNNRSGFYLSSPSQKVMINKTKISTTGSTYYYGLYSNNRSSLTDPGNERVVIKESEFSGGQQGVLLDGDDCRIEDNHFQNHQGTGFATYKVKNLKIKGNLSENNNTHGIAIGNGTNDKAINVIITDNTSRNNGYQGIVLYAQGGDAYDSNPSNFPNRGANDNVVITNNICHDNLNGIFAYVNGKTIISNNHCYSNSGNGIYSSTDNTSGNNPGEIIINGNRSINNNGSGFVFGGNVVLEKITISNNITSGNASYGFDLNSINKSLVQTNQMYSNGKSGLWLRANCQDVIISQNIGKGNNTSADGTSVDFEISVNENNIYILFNIGDTSTADFGGNFPQYVVGNTWTNQFNFGGTSELKGDFSTGFYGFLKIGSKTHSHGTSAPSSGTYSTGDVVYNTSPTAGGYVGWVCTAGGSPGTWKGFGAIEA